MLDKIKNLENVETLSTTEIDEIVSFIKESNNKHELLTMVIDRFPSDLLTDDEESDTELNENYSRLMSPFTTELKEIYENPLKYEYDETKTKNETKSENG